MAMTYRLLAITCFDPFMRGIIDIYSLSFLMIVASAKIKAESKLM